MTAIITSIFLWWLSGALALLFVTWMDHLSSDNPEDITIRHLFEGTGYALFGLILWIIIGFIALDKIDWGPFTSWTTNVLDIKLTGRPKKVKTEKPKEMEIKFTNHQPTYDRMQEINKRKAVSSEESTLKTNMLED